MLLGVGLAGAFIGGSQLFHNSMLRFDLSSPVLGSGILSLIVLLIATVSTVIGTVAMVRSPSPRSGTTNINDAVFFLVGLAGSVTGIWLCTSITLELLVRKLSS